MALKGPNKPEYAGSTANDFFPLLSNLWFLNYRYFKNTYG